VADVPSGLSLTPPQETKKEAYGVDDRAVMSDSRHGHGLFCTATDRIWGAAAVHWPTLGPEVTNSWIYASLIK
jgi:hypothetical protein